ncbi:MAG: O-antigen ligase family protein [Nitrospira sp.]|nr:O-antigen ligase family protein [Nitrospira sp.]
MVAIPYRSTLTDHLGFALIIGLVIFSPLLEGGTTHLAAMIMRLILLGAFFVYLLQMVKTNRLLLPRTMLILPVLLFLLLASISTVLSSYANQSEQWLIICLGYAGLLYLLAVFAHGWQHWMTLYKILVVMALLESGVAFFQYAVEGVARPSGTFFNPNFLAGYLAVVFVAVLAQTCYTKIWHRQFWSTGQSAIRNSLPFIMMLILASTIALTGSRGGTLALVAGIAMVISVRVGRYGLLGLVLLAALVALIPNPIRDRALAEHQLNPASYARWHMWDGAVREMTEHPLGVGLGLYRYVYPRHAVSIESELFRYGKTAYTPHNEYLQIGVELGVAGLGIMLCGMALLGRESLALLRQRLTRRQRALSLSAVAGIAVILTQATMDSNLREPAIAILLACCAGMVVFGRTLDKTNDCAEHRMIILRTPRLWAALGILSIIILGMHVLRLGVAHYLHESGAGSAKHRQWEAAIDSFQQAIRLDSKKALYHSSLAGTYFQVYRLTHDEQMAQAARHELNIAITLNPLDGRLRSLLGHVLAAKATHDSLKAGVVHRDRLIAEAVQAYQEAVELEPFAYGHHMELARMMLWIGRQSEAEEHLRSVIRLEPNFLPARESLARLCVESGRKDTAEEEYKEIVTRQRRFAKRVTNQVEREFLHVDASALEALLEGERSAT